MVLLLIFTLARSLVSSEEFNTLPVEGALNILRPLTTTPWGHDAKLNGVF